MTGIIKRRVWEVPERAATPESAFFNRRQVVKGMGLAAIAAAATALPSRDARARSLESLRQELASLAPVKFKANPAFKVDADQTPAEIAARYNNFYEFSTDKDVWEDIERFNPRPWTLEVGGLVNRPRTYDVDDLIRRLPVEERVYRFRCVEAWSMVVPWLGIPLHALLKEVQPKADAKFVKFTTFFRPQEAPRQTKTSIFAPAEPFPYTEGLTMAEASNELALLTVGAYGKILARQNGAPIRLIVPWKYGYKNIKSIVKMELVAAQPPTFWNILIPHEYGFESNVDPGVPHPRWSQAHEQDIATRQRKPTLYLNGYESTVGHLYKKA